LQRNSGPVAAIISFINRKPIQTRNRALKPHYEIVLFRPFGKIRLIWSYFETEPDAGFFLGVKGAIGGRIEPGLDRVEGGGLWGNYVLDRFPQSGRRLTHPSEKSDYV
jgi:hypothetical protein